MAGNRMWNGRVGVRLLVAAALVAAFIGVRMSGGFDRFTGAKLVNLWGGTSDPQVSSEPLLTPQGLPDFVTLAKKMRPVVVNVSTTQISQGGQGSESPFGGGEDDPFADFWRKFFGGPSPRGSFRQKSLGSGFIIDKDGSILTNNHVVENASKIVVKLADEREFEAKVVGKDAKTDVAVIKIEAKESLPVAPLGDSDRLDVGEWVMAIGNPFGLDNTVTSGIVSGKGRHLPGSGPYDSFIQTDASINPGNSGGPLINLRGEVVGINSAIYSRSGGNIGIGFAIPMNLVKELLPQLKGKGKVTRGYLGVLIQKVTPEIAESLGMNKPRGALVADVTKGGPAEAAGVKVGDVILEFDGKEIRDSNDLPIIVARTAVDKKTTMKVLRDKKETVLSITVGQMQEEQVAATTPEKGELGLTVQQVTADVAASLGLERPEGVVITAVEAGSAADDAGLRRGDIILEVDRKPVRKVADYRAAVGEVKKGKGALFLVRRGDSRLFLALKPSR